MGYKAVIDTSSKTKLAESLTNEIERLATHHDETLQRLGAADGDRDELKKGLADLKTIVGDMARLPVAPGVTKRRLPVTKEAFVAYGLKALHDAPQKGRVKGINNPWGTDFEIDEDDVLARLNWAGDDIRLLGLMLGKKHPHELREFQHFKGSYIPAVQDAVALVKEAFDIQTAGEGLEWLAMDMSEQFIEMIRIERRVAALFEEVPMRHGKLTFPTWFTDLDAFTFAENTSDSGGTAIDEGLGSKNVTSKFELEAKGFGLTVTLSKFLIEDSAIDQLPWARRAMVEALRNGEEDAIINGDTTATHMDADIAAVTRHPAKAWKGLRYQGLHASNVAKESMGGARMDSMANVRDFSLKVLGNMDEYGVEPDRLALIVGSNGNAQLLSVEPFLTANVIGRATNTSGKIGFTPFGWRYAISGRLRKNLASTGVNTSAASTADKTMSLLVCTPTWKLGKVREITLQLLDQTRAKYDQNEIVATMREAFGSPFGVDGVRPTVGAMYDQGL